MSSSFRVTQLVSGQSQTRKGHRPYDPTDTKFKANLCCWKTGQRLPGGVRVATERGWVWFCGCFSVVFIDLMLVMGVCSFVKIHRAAAS